MLSRTHYLWTSFLAAATLSCGASSHGDESSLHGVLESHGQDAHSGQTNATAPTGSEPEGAGAQAESGDRPPAPLTFEECVDLGRQARVAINEALSAVQVCEVDADCVKREVPTRCWPSCSPGIVASAEYVQAFEEQLSEGPAAAYCAEFFASECVVAQSSCPISGPAAAIVGYVCLNEKCTAQIQE